MWHVNLVKKIMRQLEKCEHYIFGTEITLNFLWVCQYVMHKRLYFRQLDDNWCLGFA